MVLEAQETNKEFYTVKQLQEILHFGKNKTYELVNHDDFPKIKIGKNILIPKDKFDEWRDRYLYKSYIM